MYVRITLSVLAFFVRPLIHPRRFSCLRYVCLVLADDHCFGDAMGMNCSEQLCSLPVREHSNSLWDLETTSAWSNSISPPRLLLAHCSSDSVSFPALPKPALHDGVANVSVSQHLRHCASSIFCNAVCRRWVTDSLDCLGECDGADGSAKAASRANLWSFANRGFATLPLWAAPSQLRGSLMFACHNKGLSSVDASRRACLAGSPMACVPQVSQRKQRSSISEKHMRFHRNAPPALLTLRLVPYGPMLGQSRSWLASRLLCGMSQSVSKLRLTKFV